MDDRRRSRIMIDRIAAMVSRVRSGSLSTGDHLCRDDQLFLAEVGYPSTIVNNSDMLVRFLELKSSVYQGFLTHCRETENERTTDQPERP